MDHRFTSEEEVFFALSIPFTYTENSIYLRNLSQRISPKIYFKD